MSFKYINKLKLNIIIWSLFCYSIIANIILCFQLYNPPRVEITNIMLDKNSSMIHFEGKVVSLYSIKEYGLVISNNQNELIVSKDNVLKVNYNKSDIFNITYLIKTESIDNKLYVKVNKILQEHIDIRHIRGGESTRQKYLKRKEELKSSYS